MELEKEELTQEQREATLKEKYGKVYRVDVELEELEKDFTFYFKKPSTPSFNRVLKTMSKKTLQTMKDFTMDNIVEEDKETYTGVMSDYPGLPMSVGQKLLSLLGVSDSVSIKKL